jgi:thiamine kinase-like enzyme
VTAEIQYADLRLACVITERVHFIDFEYVAYNYQAFDIANHFCEYAGMRATHSAADHQI